MKEVCVNSEFEEMCCYAIRYALGRRSYAPENVIRFLRPLLPFIRTMELYIWQRDISEAFPAEEKELLFGEEAEDGISDAYFRRLWLNFLKDIQAEEARRK